MKKFKASLFAVAMSAVCVSCGTTGSSSALGSLGQAGLGSILGSGSESSTGNVASAAGSVLGNILSSVLGGAAVTEKSIVGTWTYQGVDCVFESENVLAKVGGAVAASKIESNINTQLAKIGITAGSSKITFNSDKTYTMTVGSRTLSGNYTLDTANKTIKLTYLNGIGSVTPQIVSSGNTVSLLFEADKLLTIASGIGALSGNSNLSSISSILNNYSGMQVGLKLQK